MSDDIRQAGERFERVFSGKASDKLWDEINRDHHSALITLVCMCEEMEAVVKKLESRILELEKKKSSPARGVACMKENLAGCQCACPKCKGERWIEKNTQPRQST